MLLLAMLGYGPAAMAQATIPTLPMSPEAASLLPPDIRDSGVLKAATDAHFPTCNYFGEDGHTIMGFEADLRAALAQVLGLKLVSTSVDFSALIPGITGRRYDMAMECMSDTEEREKQVTFVNYAYSAGNTVFYLTTNTTIVDDDMNSLCGLKSSAPAGSTFVGSLEMLTEFCRKNGRPAVVIAEVPQASTSILGVYSGRFDFGLTNAVAWPDLQKSAPRPLKAFRYALQPRTYNGIAVRKDNTQLAAALLAAIKVVQSSGVYDQIWKKWGVAHAELAEPGINLFSTRPITP